jgi:hypothetical protein
MLTSQSRSVGAAGRSFQIILAIGIALLLLSNLSQADELPSAGAEGMPGALGTLEFKPTDWAGNVTTYWTDTDGVDPGVAGCHIGVSEEGKPNGRSFGEACQSDLVLIESNPGAGVIHPHENDLGHPDRVDCKAWCVGAKKAAGGVCKAVSGPLPCAASAVCECN